MISRRVANNHLIVAAVPVVLYVAFLALRPEAFGSGTTVYNVFQQSIITSIIAFGMSFTIMMDKIDLAVGAEIVLAAIVGAILSVHFGILGIIIGCLACGLIAGLLKAAASRYLKIPTMILTIALTYLFAAAGGIITQSKSVVIAREDAVLGHAPWNIIIFLIAGLIVYALHAASPYGAHVRAVASSPSLAARSGIDPRSVGTRALMLSSLFGGVGAILKLSHGGSAAPTDGVSSILTILQPIMCVFIGMMLMRYVNLVLGIFVGAILMSIIGNGLIAISMPSSYNNVVVGGILIALMVLISLRSIRGSKRMKIEKFQQRETAKHAEPAVPAPSGS